MAFGATGGVQIEGLNEVIRAFGKIEKSLAKEVRDSLKKAGEPVRVEAERMAVGNISNIGPVWSRMKLGSTSSGVYIALQARRRGGPGRPNVGRLLLGESILPAVAEKGDETEREVEKALDHLTREEGF
jgi:hypothetical protein